MNREQILRQQGYIKPPNDVVERVAQQVAINTLGKNYYTELTPEEKEYMMFIARQIDKLYKRE